VQNTKAVASENILGGNFNSKKENQIWTSDITYIWTKEGWLYSAVIMDIYSRKISGMVIKQQLVSRISY